MFIHVDEILRRTALRALRLLRMTAFVILSECEGSKQQEKMKLTYYRKLAPPLFYICLALYEVVYPCDFRLERFVVKIFRNETAPFLTNQLTHDLIL